MDIRRLTPADVAAVLRLADLAGWNQTDRDVRRLLALEPDGCFAAVADGYLVGSATTTTYGTDLAWVGMVLVDPAYRRRGIATALMDAALGYLRGKGMATIKLDATPLGRPVYERLGFVAESLLERWEREAPLVTDGELTRAGWDEIADLDRAAFGADRENLLRRLITDTRPPFPCVDFDFRIIAYAFTRPGTRATYVGPVVAEDFAAAGSLLLGLLLRLGGPMYIDVNTDFPGARDLLQALGFTRQRELLRMRLGPDAHVGLSRRVFAIAGPEVG